MVAFSGSDTRCSGASKARSSKYRISSHCLSTVSSILLSVPLAADETPSRDAHVFPFRRSIVVGPATRFVHCPSASWRMTRGGGRERGGRRQCPFLARRIHTSRALLRVRKMRVERVPLEILLASTGLIRFQAIPPGGRSAPSESEVDKNESVFTARPLLPLLPFSTPPTPCGDLISFLGQGLAALSRTPLASIIRDRKFISADE